MSDARARSSVARPAVLLAGLTSLLLLAVSGRYGYHRDELYFLECGRHLAWGYPDQPPLVPFLAHVMSSLSATSLVVLRLPSDLAIGGVVLVVALTARELGGDRAAQTLAAGVAGLASVCLATGHLLSTSTFDLLASAVVAWLVVRIASGGDERLWLVVGVVAGLGLLDNDLMASFLASLIAGVLVVGPRRLLASRWLWLGALIAAAMWSPYLVWQGSHGWPQFTVARAIANGSSGTSTPRWQVVPFQVLLVSPVLTPVWVAGLVRLLRRPEVRHVRFIGVGYLVLLAAVLISGGKSYYPAGYFPVLIAAGAAPSVAWLRRRRYPRRAIVGGVFWTVPGLLVVLPLLPLSALSKSPVVGLNYDAGETVGWPSYVAEVASAYRRAAALPGGPPVIVASNYGEAGAIDRYGGTHGLPVAYSGHNAFYLWGPPPGQARAALLIGFDRSFVTEVCRDERLLTKLDNHHDVADDEQGAQVWSCELRAATWTQVWPAFRALG